MGIGTTPCVRRHDDLAHTEEVERALGAKPQVTFQRSGSAFTGDSLDGLPVPVMDWHTRGLVPMRNVTLLGGDGGVGKASDAKANGRGCMSQQ
jgi:hypothetical protein